MLSRAHLETATIFECVPLRIEDTLICGAAVAAPAPATATQTGNWHALCTGPSKHTLCVLMAACVYAGFEVHWAEIREPCDAVAPRNGRTEEAQLRMHVLRRVHERTQHSSVVLCRWHRADLACHAITTLEKGHPTRQGLEERSSGHLMHKDQQSLPKSQIAFANQPTCRLDKY